MNIINLTQHAATAEQLAAGVIDPVSRKSVSALLTFVGGPTVDDIRRRAAELAMLAAESGAEAAMIGGAGYLMPALEAALRQRGIRPLHAFSARVSRDEAQPDGSVRKISAFEHRGWVETPDLARMAWLDGHAAGVAGRFPDLPGIGVPA